MIGVLHQFLVENGYVLLQDTGLFTYTKIPAVYDQSELLFFAPKQVFQINAITEADTALTREIIRFIARKLNTTEERAFDKYQDFCAAFKTELIKNGSVKWPLLGHIHRNSQGEFSIEPLELGNKYHKPISATKVIRQNESHQLLVGTTETNTEAMREHYELHEPPTPNKATWWISALIIGLTAIILIYLRKSEIL